MRKQLISALLLGVILAPAMCNADAVEQLLDASGVQGGLVVHLGCGDGEETAPLRVNEAYLVQGLDVDAANVQAARKNLLASGQYGPISVDRFDGRHLPYADDLVNAILSPGPTDVPVDEILRALVPGGVAMIDGRKLVKPWPDSIDQWSHHLHGPDNNPVAMDTQVDTPRRLKWICKPLWTRSHEFLSSMTAMVSADGRIYYIFDEGLTSITDAPIPERWTLIARDAFNGMLLWKRPLENWDARTWGAKALRSTPRSIPYRLVAGDDRVFMTLGHSDPVSAIDAATGKILATFDGTSNAQEMRYLDGVLMVRTAASQIVAVDTATGEQLWTIDEKVRPQMFAASENRVFCVVEETLSCLQLRDGKTIWRADEEPTLSQLVVHENSLLTIGRGAIKVRNAKTGDVRWEAKGPGGRGGAFVANDRIYQPAGQRVVVRDLATGNVETEIQPADVMTWGHHARCYPGKGTERFYIAPNRGVEFVDLFGDEHTQNDWTRGPCTYGVLPCNGMLYVPPNPCFCYTGVKVTGFNAYVGAEATDATKRRMPDRLERGPAYGKTSADSSGPTTDSWPTYRHDARRSGGSRTTVSAKLKPSWQIELGGRLTQPIVAGGSLYVASKDAHTVHAIDERSGKLRWQYTADGRIDSPPTVDGGRILFGTAGGYVYCLSARDGQLAWRFRAATTDRRIMAFGQLESPWRVHGSVLVEKGIAYVTAGRSTNLDDGILVFGLEPASGKVLHQTRLDSWARTRIDAVNKPFIPGYHMEGAFSDILVSEGGSIYLGQYKLDGALKQQDVPYALLDPQKSSPAMTLEQLIDQPYVQDMKTQIPDEKRQREWQLNQWPEMAKQHREKYGASNLGERTMGRHVFATGSFLDDSWYNRTFWMYSETWPGFHIANWAAKTGQLLSVDDEKTYALQAFPRRNLQSPLFTPGQAGYLLLADDNDNEPVIPDYTRGVPKGIGFTRQRPPVWHKWIPVRVRAMVATKSALFVAGPPDTIDPEDPMAAFEGRAGARLWALSSKDGEKLAEYELSSPPVFDGLIAAHGKLYVSTEDGKVTCWAAE
ncbi:MAG: PQQ-binding-like beta-propeller repeat protein [Thermoguttaceae bacterium]